MFSMERVSITFGGDWKIRWGKKTIKAALAGLANSAVQFYFRMLLPVAVSYYYVIPLSYFAT